MLDSERDRIFSDWLAAHKWILFRVVRASAFEHADRQDLFQEVAIQVWRWTPTTETRQCRRGSIASPWRDAAGGAAHTHRPSADVDEIMKLRHIQASDTS